MATHNELGKKGEAVAKQYLLDQGYCILATNWRHQKAEVDIIAKDITTLVAVEVKTRSKSIFGAPQDFITPHKIQLLIQAMDAYIDQHQLDVEVRFDVVGILQDKNNYKVEHLKNAFYHF